MSAPDIGGNYSLILTVSDGIDDEILTITISVLDNQSPYAVPGDDIPVPVSGIFTLSASDSYDPDGSGSLSYLWNIDDCLLAGFSLVEDEDLASSDIKKLHMDPISSS